MQISGSTARSILLDSTTRPDHLGSLSTVSQLALLATSSSVDQASFDAASEYSDSLVRLLESHKEAFQASGACEICTAAQEGSSQLVVGYLEQWISKLLAVIRGQEKSMHVKIACWQAVGSLYGRASELIDIPGVRRDASQHARQFMLLVTETFMKGEEPLQLAQLRALASIMGAVPASCKASSKALEELVVEHALLSSTAAPALRLAASHVLASLPQTAGDAQSWSLLMQRLLWSSHLVLDAAFMGLEDIGLADSAKSTVQPNVQQLGPGAHTHPANLSAQKERGLLAIFGGLLDCVERMMTDSQTTPVAVPSSSLFMLAVRVLSFDDSAVASGKVAPSSSAYHELIAALPSLHQAALKLLQIWLRAGRAALTPFFASAARLMCDLLSRICAQNLSAPVSWQVQQEVYLTSSELVGIAGMGAAAELLQPTLACAVASFLATLPAAGSDKGQSPPPKKRKTSKQKDKDFTNNEAVQAAQRLVSGEPVRRQTAAQQALLQLMCSLLKVCGSSIKPTPRLALDTVTLQAAMTSGRALSRLVMESQTGGREVAAVQLHLSALRCLLASVLSPCAARPAFLPQATQLFQQGCHAAHPELAAFCRDALLSCEALLHPRALPLQSRPAEAPPAGAGAALQALLPHVQAAPILHAEYSPGAPTNSDELRASGAAGQAGTPWGIFGHSGLARRASALTALGAGQAPSPAPKLQAQDKLQVMPAASDQLVAPEVHHKNDGQDETEGLVAIVSSPLELPVVSADECAEQGSLLRMHIPEAQLNGSGGTAPAAEQSARIASKTEALDSDSEGDLPEIDSGQSSEED